MMVPPSEQFLASYTVSTPASGFSINYINVVAPNAAVGAVKSLLDLGRAALDGKNAERMAEITKRLTLLIGSRD